MRDALKEAADAPKPGIDELFNDVYEELPWHLREQRDELKAHLKKYEGEYKLNTWIDGEKWHK